MQIKSISQKGLRDNNEDSYLILENKNVFMVCDGVGGAAKGEVASGICCSSFNEYFNSTDIVFPTETEFQKIIEYTELNFEQYLEKNETQKSKRTSHTF